VPHASCLSVSASWREDSRPTRSHPNRFTLGVPALFCLISVSYVIYISFSISHSHCPTMAIGVIVFYALYPTTYILYLLLHTGRYHPLLTPKSYILYPFTMPIYRQSNMTMKKVTQVAQSLVTCCKIRTYGKRGDSRIEKRL
jgi:hypothetical protein